jgi:MYXO-CTERM domain-containing protein
VAVSGVSGDEFIIVWESYGSPGTDTLDGSIQGQVFSVPDVPSLSPAAAAAAVLLFLLAGAFALRRRA